MNRFWKFTIGAGLLLAALVAAGAEALGGWAGSEWRVPVYAGGAAGLILNAVGLPFVLKLASLPPTAEASRRFWAIWGAGILARLFLILGLALTLLACFPQQALPAVLPMAAVYLLGMFAESAWLAHRLFRMDKAKHG